MNICEWSHLTIEGTQDTRFQVLALIRDSLVSELEVGTFNLLEDTGWDYVLTLRDAVKKLDKLINELETKEGNDGNSANQ